ncbi:MAG: ParB N-terminal domain-containing protein [Alphaproteobacteria bacterium]|nr:ParB N-terminal domain-containing protein [Alphaproteobacteria bacterium]
MTNGMPPVVEQIPLDAINVVNPRVRNQRVFKEIVDNIAQLGLKRPITVSRKAGNGSPKYELVCGQGRLEAYRVLKQVSIPAIIVDANSEDCMVMSLVENLARRQHRAIDLLRDIHGLKQRGYDELDIAAKTGLTVEYVRGVVRLLETGEHRLLRAVESGHIPISVAVEIANSADGEVQHVLHEAYERKLLRGNKLAIVKRIIAQRQRRGKGLDTTSHRRPLSVERLLRTYRDDAERKQAMVRKADITRGKLVFVIEALKKLLADEHFRTLLRAEGLETVPSNIASRLVGTTH